MMQDVEAAVAVKVRDCAVVPALASGKQRRAEGFAIQNPSGRIRVVERIRPLGSFALFRREDIEIAVAVDIP